jgi:hypothetical protein
LNASNSLRSIDEHCAYLKSVGEVADCNTLTALFDVASANGKDHRNIVTALINSLNADSAFLAAKFIQRPPAANSTAGSVMHNGIEMSQQQIEAAKSLQAINDMRLAQSGVTVPFAQGSDGMFGGSDGLSQQLRDERNTILRTARDLNSQFSDKVVNKLEKYINDVDTLEKEINKYVKEITDYLTQLRAGNISRPTTNIDEAAMAALEKMNDKNVNANMQQLKTLYKVHSILGTMTVSVENAKKAAPAATGFRY